MPVPYTFGTATSSIPLSQLDSNFATAITIGNTAVQLGNTVTTLNNMTLANVTISSGNVTVTNVSVTTANVSGTANVSTMVVIGNDSVGGNTTVTGNISTASNLTFTGTGNRITGDFSNATSSNRVLFQTSTTNNQTATGLLPNGTSTQSQFAVYNGSDPLNSAQGRLLSNATEFRIENLAVGTGTYLPMTFYTNNSERMRIDTSGNVGIGTSSPTGYGNVNLNLNSSGDTMLHMTNTTSGTTSGDGFDILLTGLNAQLINREAGYVSMYTSATERMRIDSSGNLLVGVTSSVASERLNVTRGSSSLRVAHIENSRNGTNDECLRTWLGTNCNNASSYHYIATTGGTDRFIVFGNGNAVNTNNSYGALSDIKLKENITDATPKLDGLMQVRVVNYNLIGDTQKQLGVVAQELEQIFPAMVDETPDRDVDENELGTTTKSVKYSVFVPMLIKAIQEQQALITALTNRIEALEGAKK